jgi:HEAT repeat protein
VWVRSEAALALWRVARNKEAAVRTLTEGLAWKDRVPSVKQQLVRRRAAQALGDMGPAAAAAVPALEAAWKGSEPELRVAAAAALWRIGRHREAALRTLTQALRDKEYRDSRYQLVWTLGSLGPEARAAVPALREALDDPDSLVRRSAAEALKKIDPGAATPGGRP